MQNLFGSTGRTLGIGALLALAATQASFAQSTPHETTLLGVTLLKSSYRDVLRKYGRPDEIQAGGPFVPSEGAPAGRAGGQGMMGGPSGGGGGKAISKSGFPGRGGTGASSPGGGMMGGMMGGGKGQMGGGMPAGMGGYPGMGGGGLPGFNSGGGAAGMAGSDYPGLSGGSGGNSGGGPAMGNSGGAAGEASAEQPNYEATWWYHDRMNAIHKSFLFNKDGRVIQVQEYGHDPKHKGSKTRKGVGLGSGLNAVLQNYGWSNDGANEGRNMIMRFGGEDKVAFQLVNNRVVGITIAVVKDVPKADEP